jgi:predicted ATPase
MTMEALKENHNEVRAEYIRRIEIEALWGRKHIVWDLRRDVNILSGINGIGKSTILNRAAAQLDHLAGIDVKAKDIDGVKMTFYPEEATTVHFDVIRSFDRPLFHSNLAEKMAEKYVKTELDWQLYQLQRRYLDYQVNIGNRIIELLSSGDEEGHRKAAEVSYPKRRFQDLTDELFSETGKKIIRSKNEIVFDQEGRELLPYRLSSGEKQMLVILLTVLVQDKQPCVLLMDEPEVSLHIEWQQRIISIIREMNPHAQIILTTHSPAMIMGGWMDAVTEVTDITI